MVTIRLREEDELRLRLNPKGGMQENKLCLRIEFIHVTKTL